MPSPQEIAASMTRALAATDPELDTSIGTPTRKILDVVAESIGEAYLDSQLLSYQYDIDAKIGADLDDFVGLFGFARLARQRANGVVVFSRSSANAAKEAAYIPPGTQIVALRNPPVYVQTVLPAVLGVGQVSADVPVQAVEGGVAGNVPARTLTVLASAANGVSTVINTEPLTGGTEQESDVQLRARFKATVFRSLAGTEQMYMGLALEVPGLGEEEGSRAVSKVNVVGVTKTYVEQVQVVAGVASTTVDDPAFIYDSPVFVGFTPAPTPDGPTYTFLTPGIHFAWQVDNNVVPSTGKLQNLTVGTTAGLPDGLYDLTFEYLPKSSRNDPKKGISNRVDVFVNGQKATEATQTIVFPSNTAANTFNDTTTDDRLYRQKYRRKATLVPPDLGNIFVPLAFGPLSLLPDSISITGENAGVAYVEGTDYFLVERHGPEGLTSNSLTGIEWVATKAVTAGKAFPLTYVYNSVPREVEERVQQWRLLGTDARVHQGKEIALRFNLAIMYSRDFAPSSVNTAVDTALAEFVNGLGFRSTVQVSDILQVVHNVAGVDNVRFIRQDENGTSFALQQMLGSTVHKTFHTSGRAKDIIFGDDEIPVFHSTTVVAKAANTFGTI